MAGVVCYVGKEGQAGVELLGQGGQGGEVVGQGQGEMAVTDHNSGRSPMHGPFRISPQGGLF